MRQRQVLAVAALLIASTAVRAEHFAYTVDLHGTYSLGGTDGCTPPFDQPACPRDGYLSATVSFDTPSTADGAYLIEDSFGDITDFKVDLGSLSDEALYGGVNLASGVPNGTVQDFDGFENFTFDLATRSASYSYDYGYHNANGSFSGALYEVPEPPVALMLLLGLAISAAAWRRGDATRPSRHTRQ